MAQDPSVKQINPSPNFIQFINNLLVVSKKICLWCLWGQVGGNLVVNTTCCPSGYPRLALIRPAWKNPHFCRV